jgi:multiple sugar transport system permease protein
MNPVSSQSTPKATNLERPKPAPAGRQWLLTILIVAFCIYFLLPLYWVLVSITKDNGQLNTTFGLWFATPWHLVENFQQLLNTDNGIFFRWMLNSFVYSFAVGILATAAAAMAGFAFAMFAFRGRDTIFNFILGTIMVPATALTFPIFLLINNIGLANTIWAVILPQMVNPFGLYLMRIFWQQGFPKDLMEAAYLDGATNWQIFWSLGLPLVRGGLITVFLFSFVGAWNNFFLPLIVLNDTSLFPLTLGLSIWNNTNTGQTPRYTMIILGALLSILPLIISFFALGRYWQGGLTTGATKG